MADNTKLTPKQQAFAEEYLKDLNATRAYKEVYKNIKNDSVAWVNGSRLLSNAKVKCYIDEVMEKASNNRIATATEVMEFLTRGMKQELEEEVVSFSMEGDVLRTTKKNTSKEAIKCAELLGKRYALFTDNQNINANIGVVILDDIGE
ncbi:MAG: terminase small subunit [Sarcina sp.]